MNDIERDDRLVAAAGGLSTEISPARDLWPEIAEAIARPQRSRWTPMLAQAAAVVLLIGASSGITYLAVKEDPQLVPVVMQDLRFEQAAFGAEHTFGSVYRSAQGDYRVQLEQQLERLPPETRTEVERNLTLIREAIAEINVALKENPDNVLLQDLLVKSYREQHALMRRVGELAQHVMARKDI
ncbi:MAG: hypothetical protein OEM60_12415 [Gammaproteobacteria bacterium]|nr:hypothetical protein [Gammaproteobacteria bacterium]MDH3434660.1 hypothetical protein [Gammaproteobacteria bacterium]